jgi:hypothetical protein
MADPSYRGLRRSVAVVTCLVSVAAVLTGSPPAVQAVDEPLRVLQLNLCDSGIARCYTGRSMARAEAVIRAQRPDVVTLNEICQEDVSALARLYPDGVVRSTFAAAIDRRTGGPFRCRNGRPYGIGLLVRHGSSTDSGVYPTQDPGDPEERVWLCGHTAGFTACTTHLASTSRSVALAQCGYLMRRGFAPMVLGGDLNLGTADLSSCLPPGYPHRGDGALQHIVATPGFAVGSSRSIDMDGTTDHPGLLVTLAARPAR